MKKTIRPGSHRQPVARPEDDSIRSAGEVGRQVSAQVSGSSAARRGRAGAAAVSGPRARRRRPERVPSALGSPRRRRGTGAMDVPPPRPSPASLPPPGFPTPPAAQHPGRVRPRARRLRPCARRRHGDGHKTPAPGAPANRSARRGETRTSLFQDGGASVASGPSGGKPAEPSPAAARDGTEAAVAAVGGDPGRFRCCDGCCHAARLGRTSLPRGGMMLTEVSGAPLFT